MHHLNKSIIMIILNFKKQAKTIKYIQKNKTKQNKTNKIKKNWGTIIEGGGIRTRASL